VRPRSANEWRQFWHHGGDDELRSLLQELWPPLQAVDDEAAALHSERIALLLGSAAPPRALASELGRIRAELGASPDADADRAAAERVNEWFLARSR
jgi:hypothetical protein